MKKSESTLHEETRLKWSGLPQPAASSSPGKNSGSRSSLPEIKDSHLLKASKSPVSCNTLRKKEQKLLGDNRFKQLLVACDIPLTEDLIRVFDVAYRKPLNAHGSLYIFVNYLCFSKNRNVKWAVPMTDIQKIEVHKGNHSPKTFVFLHLGDGASYVMHKFRGRTGRNRREMAATVVLTWEYARGNKSVDLALLRTTGQYALKHPALKQHLGSMNQEDEEEDGEDEGERLDDSSQSSAPSAPSENKEFWAHFGDFALPPAQNALPDCLKQCQPQNIDNPDKETTFPIPVERTWQLLFADNSTYIGDYQQKNGAYDYDAAKWDNKQCYLERVCRFKKPIQSKLMSGTCEVTQEQKACFLNDGKLFHFGESQMLGVPKGDCFKLKSMYEMSDAGGTTKVRYWAWIDWHKSGGLLKGPIGSGTLRAALESFDLQMEYVKSKIPTARALDSSATEGPASLSSSQGPAAQVTVTTVQTTALSKAPRGFWQLSLLEMLLLAMVVILLATTLYYRSSASALSMVVEELQRQRQYLVAGQ